MGGSDESPDGPEISHRRSISIPAEDVPAPQPGDDELSTPMRAIAQALARLQQEDPERYGAPDRPGTLAQTWNVFTVLGVRMVCVLIRERPVPVDLVPPSAVAALGIEEVMIRIRTFFTMGGASLIAFVDDRGSAQMITLTGWADGVVRFVPAQAATMIRGIPTQSELAVPEPYLARDLTGVLAWPSLWAEAGSEPGALRLEAVQTSEFWSAFGVREIDRTHDHYGQLVVRLSTGAGSPDDATAQAVLDDHGRIKNATLRLREEWVIGPDYGVHSRALELANGFIAAFVPPADRAALARVRLPRSPAALMALVTGPATTSEPASQLGLAYAGAIPDASLRFSMSGVEVNRPGDSTVTITISTY